MINIAALEGAPSPSRQNPRNTSLNCSHRHWPTCSKHYPRSLPMFGLPPMSSARFLLNLSRSANLTALGRSSPYNPESGRLNLDLNLRKRPTSSTFSTASMSPIAKVFPVSSEITFSLWLCCILTNPVPDTTQLAYQRHDRKLMFQLHDLIIPAPSLSKAIT